MRLQMLRSTLSTMTSQKATACGRWALRMIIFSSCPHTFLVQSLKQDCVCTKNSTKVDFLLQRWWRTCSPGGSWTTPLPARLRSSTGSSRGNTKTTSSSNRTNSIQIGQYFPIHFYVNTFKSEPSCMYPCVSLPVPNKAEKTKNDFKVTLHM